jgi:hypothetical protein
MRAARRLGHELFIVSHKTRQPFRGEPYDLHQAARGWVEAAMRDAEGDLIPAENIFFEVTKEEKLGRVGALQCECFIDDLPEILRSPHFPAGVLPILFDPDGIHAGEEGLTRVGSWPEIAQHIGVDRA